MGKTKEDRIIALLLNYSEGLSAREITNALYSEAEHQSIVYSK